VSCDEIAGAAHFAPPTANGRGIEQSRIVVDADADPALILRQIIDAVRDRLAQSFVQKIIDAHQHGLSLGLPFLSGVFEATDEFLSMCRVSGTDCNSS